jgi:WD40 repeat protein
LIATAGEDGAVRIWDVARGRPTTRPLAHGARINDLTWSPDGRRLATAGGDGLARVWELEADERSLPAWTETLSRCPYALSEDVLVERRFVPD